LQHGDVDRQTGQSHNTNDCGLHYRKGSVMPGWGEVFGPIPIPLKTLVGSKRKASQARGCHISNPT